MTPATHATTSTSAAGNKNAFRFMFPLHVVPLKAFRHKAKKPVQSILSLSAQKPRLNET